MLDVLEQEKEMEEEYAAVLGASDEKCCTYAKGPIKRQALYSCLTCCPEARTNLERCAGICLACSYKCHENHELIELYTKRNFRCDCPTQRMGESNRCVLNGTVGGDKVQPANLENLYNQNFQGLYCICHRPYPDPERASEEVMLQCAICEDWYHLQHLDVPPEYGKIVDSCNEMICGSCMQEHKFLHSYTGLALKALAGADESAANISVTGLETSICDDNKLKSDLDKSISEIMNIGNEGGGGEMELGQSPKDQPNEQNTVNEKPRPREESALNEPAHKRIKLEDKNASESSEEKNNVECRRPKGKIDYEKGATFWGNDWRSALCQCHACMEIYKAAKIEFLLDTEDSSKSYEERGIKRAASEASTYEDGIRALASIGRVQQIDAITEYNRMKDKLMNFLQTFAVSNKVVTEEDINRFFEGMRNEKNANLGQPFFCR